MLKAAGQFPTDEELNKFLEEWDTDGDGEISYDEFLLLVNKKPQAAKSISRPWKHLTKASFSMERHVIYMEKPVLRGFLVRIGT